MIAEDTPLILGSASPRRREILAGLGVPLRVVTASISEACEGSEPPHGYVRRMAVSKLVAVAERLRREPVPTGFGALLAADTIVVLDGTILGKPVDVSDARRLLSRLVGRSHFVYTSYALAAPEAPAEPRVVRTVETTVTMRAATEQEIERYAATGEGLDKAGAYAAQGIGAFLVARIDGSYPNVVGLPACEVIQDLCAAGLLASYP